MIQLKTYKLNSIVLTNEIISAYINNFWKDIFSKIASKQSKKIHLMLLLKVYYTDSELGYRTLGYLRRVNLEDKELFQEYITERLGILSDAYTSHSISKIVFTYITKDGLASEEDRKLLQDLSDKTLTTHRFSNINLPTSMDPKAYGIIRGTTIYPEFTRYFVDSNTRMFEIDVSIDGLTNKVRVVGLSDLKWVDTKLSEGFKREIGKSTIYFLDGEIVLRKQILALKPFTRGKIDGSIITNFVTMDIETIRNSNGELIPYLIKAWNKSRMIESYSGKQNILFNNFITELMNNFFNNSNKLYVYAHNLSGFDGIFLMRHLMSVGKVEPLLFNGKLICIKVKLNISGYEGKTIIFKDSFLLLPFSLRNLCVSFGVVVPKGYFPFNLTNIYYTGVFPKFDYWTDISSEKWSELKTLHGKRIWNFKDEASKYCGNDCIALHDILTKFNELIYDKFNVNIHNSLTLPSLAMRIFKTHYLPENKIFQLVGRVEQAIRESYTGGAVDVYVPHNKINALVNKGKGDYTFKQTYNKLYYYDVNSLYPYVMAFFSMPIGLPIYFEGNIRRVEPNAYGFFYCKITSPKYLEHPILQRKIRTSEGLRTIAGLGSWEGWIYSKELDNALKYGYTFEILHGYQFEQGNLFNKYILYMYSLRLSYPKSDPMNMIAKLLMNSLYGKFGMKLDVTSIEVLPISTKENKQMFKKYLDKWGSSIQDYVLIDNKKVIVIRNTEAKVIYNEELDMYHGMDINIAIASAITASARIHMSQFKNNPDFNIYYSDTDSIVISSALPTSFIGKKLGQLKLEYVIRKAVFLAPKVYGLITDDNKEIIKIKGITSENLKDFHINDLDNLLVQDVDRCITQEKWYKDILQGTINIKDMAYTLKVTSNKRYPIYTYSIYSNTKPYHYNDLIASDQNNN